MKHLGITLDGYSRTIVHNCTHYSVEVAYTNLCLMVGMLTPLAASIPPNGTNLFNNDDALCIRKNGLQHPIDQ